MKLRCRCYYNLVLRSRYFNTVGLVSAPLLTSCLSESDKSMSTRPNTFFFSSFALFCPPSLFLSHFLTGSRMGWWRPTWRSWHSTPCQPQRNWTVSEPTCLRDCQGMWPDTDMGERRRSICLWQKKGAAAATLKTTWRTPAWLNRFSTVDDPEFIQNFSWHILSHKYLPEQRIQLLYPCLSPPSDMYA